MAIDFTSRLIRLAPLSLIFLPGLAGAAYAEEADPDSTKQYHSEILVIAALDDPSAGLAEEGDSLSHTEITAMAPLTALEPLSLIPGVTAFEKGGPGAGSYLSIRGGEPNFTLVTLNGIRVNDPLQTAGGAFDFSLLDPADITQINILSGPRSIAYGADSLAGIADLKIGGSPNAALITGKGGIGTNGRYAFGGRVALDGTEGRLFAAAHLNDTRDLHSASSNRTETYLLAARPELGESFSLNLFGLVARADSIGFPEDSGGPQLAVLRTLETRNRSLMVLGSSAQAQLSPSFAAQLKLGWTRSELAADSPGIAPGVLDAVPPIANDSHFERLEVAGQFDVALDSAARFSVGGNFVHETGRSNGTLNVGVLIPTDYRQKRALPGIFAMIAMGQSDGAILHGGLRVDFPENGEARWTPSLGGQLPLGDSGFFVSANAAKGFKQPSLFALGYPLIANPDLQAETGTSYDVGIEWRSGNKKSVIGARLFRSDYRNLVDFDPDLFTNVNRNRVTVEGVETFLEHRSRWFGVRAAFTYLDTESEDGAQLRFRPRWTGRAALDFPVAPEVNLRVDGEFSSSFLDSSVPTGFVRMDGFITFGAELRWSISDNLRLTGTLRNLANANYARTVGTPEPGRNIFVALEARF